MKKNFREGVQETCDRVRDLRKLLGFSQKVFAESIGVTQGYLSLVERCEQAPPLSLLLAICFRFKASEEWLLMGKGGPFPADSPESGLPIFSPSLVFSSDGKFSGEKIGQIALPELSQRVFGLCQRGDFMAPTINAGDIVLCEPQYQGLKNEDLVLITNKWNTCIVRRLRMSSGPAMLTADNSVYQPFPLTNESMVVATVVMVLRVVHY